MFVSQDENIKILYTNTMQSYDQDKVSLQRGFILQQTEGDWLSSNPFIYVDKQFRDYAKYEADIVICNEIYIYCVESLCAHLYQQWVVLPSFLKSVVNAYINMH